MSNIPEFLPLFKRKTLSKEVFKLRRTFDIMHYTMLKGAVSKKSSLLSHSQFLEVLGL